MDVFGQTFRESQRSAETIAQFAIVLWVLALIFAIAAAIWIFRDAEARGKSGLAAALIAFLSALYGIPLTLIVLCTWILFRPEKSRRESSDGDLPQELPSGIVAAPTASEFLKEMGENTNTDESPAKADNV